MPATSTDDFHCRITEQVQDQEKNLELDVLAAISISGSKCCTKFVQYLCH